MSRQKWKDLPVASVLLDCVMLGCVVGTEVDLGMTRVPGSGVVNGGFGPETEV